MQSGLVLGAPPPLPSLLEAGDAALFLDFDGTLVELAKQPDAITPLPDLANRLRFLAQRLDGNVAVVSGRALIDIEQHIGPIPVAAAGSHGSDIRAADGRALGAGPLDLPLEIEEELRAFASQEGLTYEHKPHGGALHYRSNPDLGEKAHAFAEQLASEHGWTVQSGKCVAELVAAGGGKGGAVNLLMKDPPFAGARPFFIGDDLTDEAGFKACQDFGGAGILVGDREETCAQYRLSDVAAVHKWLEL